MSDSLTINGHLVEFHEMDEDTGRINFKLDNTWRDPMDFIIPGCTALEFIMRIHNFGAGFWSRELKGPASNSEVRRWLDNSAIRFNGKALKPKDKLDFPCILLYYSRKPTGLQSSNARHHAQHLIVPPDW